MLGTKLEVSALGQDVPRGSVLTCWASLTDVNLDRLLKQTRSDKYILGDPETESGGKKRHTGVKNSNKIGEEQSRRNEETFWLFRFSLRSH